MPNEPQTSRVSVTLNTYHRALLERICEFEDISAADVLRAGLRKYAESQFTQYELRAIRDEIVKQKELADLTKLEAADTAKKEARLARLRDQSANPDPYTAPTASPETPADAV